MTEINKKTLSERDICTKYITLAIAQAGWDVQTQVREEVTFTKGRIIVKGRLVSRGETKRADYILYCKPNIPIALIEAKDNNHSVGSGMQQAIAYAEILDIPFVYSSNGDAFLERDRTIINPHTTFTRCNGAIAQLLTTHEPDAFTQHWQRICDNFDLLYSIPENISKLRQAILQLAVQGKLVPQDPNDEPASVLLEKIKAKKEQLVEGKKVRKNKPLPLIDVYEVPDEIPKSWKWVCLDDISDIGTGSTPLTSNLEYYENGNVPWITSAATSEDFIIAADSYITASAVADYRLRVYPPGTLIVALYGQGKTRGQISQLKIAVSVNQACAAITFIEATKEVGNYVRKVFEKKYDELRALAAGGAQPNLNVRKIKETLIPLPPLEEQKRIVAKVDQLMALCDELEAKLIQSQTNSEKLIDVSVRQVLMQQLLKG